MSLIPIEGRDGYFRDISTKAIVNKNMTDYNNYILNRNKLSSDHQKIDNLQNEIDQMKDDLSDLKIMLKHFIDNHK